MIMVTNEITLSLHPTAVNKRKVLPSELTNTFEQFIVYVHRNEAHFTYIYVYHTNVFEAGNIFKNLPKCNFTYLFLQFLFRSGAPPMTLLTAGALTALPDPQLPVTASTCAPLLHGWVPPPQTKILATHVGIIFTFMDACK